ncbi:MAG: hypothetical protein ACP5FL_00280 [Thermoplasmatota archaeon]
MAEKAMNKKMEELENRLRYQEAVLEEMYNAQQSLFPVFVDLVKLISRMYDEMDIEDKDVQRRISRLEDLFVDREAIAQKYGLDSDHETADYGMAYT